MATKRVIVLERRTVGSGLSFRYVLWCDIPLANQSTYTNPTKVSEFRGIGAQDLTDLRAGKFTEIVRVGQWPAATTIAVIQTALQLDWQTFQTQVANEATWQQYGRSWDGTTWIAGA